MREKLGSFAAGFASEEETAAAIRETFAGTGYCVDPHTAVAVSVCEKYYAKSGDPVGRRRIRLANRLIRAKPFPPAFRGTDGA